MALIDGTNPMSRGLIGHWRMGKVPAIVQDGRGVTEHPAIARAREASGG
jgi:hypothetical protein